MNILFISAILPYPLHSGGQVRIYNLLKQLSKEHTITLFSFIRSNEEKKYVKELSFLKETQVFLRGNVWQVPYILRALTSSLPLLMASYEHRQMKQALVREIRNHQYDLIHIEPFYVYPSLPLLSVPLVVVEHNIEYMVYGAYADQFFLPLLRPFFRWDIDKLRTQEQYIWKQAKKIITVSGGDKEEIIKTVGKDQVMVVENGVDVKMFTYNTKSFAKKEKTIVFVGNYNWVPNVQAVTLLLSTYWPLLKKTFSDMQLIVVGKDLPSNLQTKLRAAGGVYKQNVEDIRDIYKEADILFAPMTIAGGTKFKVLEAMASGCLVVTTDEGVAGTGAVSGKHYIRITTPSTAVAGLRNIYDYPKESMSITKKAREFIEMHYDWAVIAKKQSAVWKSLV